MLYQRGSSADLEERIMLTKYNVKLRAAEYHGLPHYFAAVGRPRELVASRVDLAGPGVIKIVDIKGSPSREPSFHFLMLQQPQNSTLNY